MIKKILTDPIDEDLYLKELAIEHPEPEMRAMANLSIGVGVDHSYYPVRELRAAVALCLKNPIFGRAPLADILSADACDYQRAIFFGLAGRGVERMLELLEEFELHLEARGRAGRSLADQGVTAMRMVDPYRCEFAFGPVCKEEFEIDG